MAEFMSKDGYQIHVCAMVVVQPKIEKCTRETTRIPEIDVKSSSNISGRRVQVGPKYRAGLGIAKQISCLWCTGEIAEHLGSACRAQNGAGRRTGESFPGGQNPDSGNRG